MASISEERLREMEEEMDRFEAEIQGPGGPPPPGRGFILGAKTYDKVQAQLSSLRQESSQRARTHDSDAGDQSLEDEDFRPARKRKFQEDEDSNEFHDIDERPGRPQGPIVPPPPPPPSMPSRPPPTQAPVSSGDLSNMFAPPPPPPPEPEGDNSTLSFKPYAPGEGPHVPRPAFMPPQLRHRGPPPGGRPPFPRPPMRMGGPPGPPHFGGPPGPPRPPPHMMGHGPNMGPNSGPMGHHGPPMGHVGPTGPPAPPMGMPRPQIAPPGMDTGSMQFMTPSMEETTAKPAIVEQPKVVYSAAPVITVERKAEDKKKKKKKKAKTEGDTGTESKEKGQTSKESIGPAIPIPSSIATTAEEDKSLADMEIVPDSAMVGGIMAATLTPGATMAAAASINAPGGAGGKKEKKKKEKKFIRLAASTVWEDPTLAEWQQDDFRMFCGDLGNEVTDETLVRAFNKYPSFLKAKVIRDRRTNKTKGYGFVSFKDPVDFTRAMREMNGSKKTLAFMVGHFFLSLPHLEETLTLYSFLSSEVFLKLL